MDRREGESIPLVDLKAQYSSLKQEIGEAVEKVMATASFIGGKEVREFEISFGEFCGVKHCIGVANGTDALTIALKCLGIGHGDEVITVPNTFIATAEAISLVGATPVFVDVDEKTFNMDPAKLEEVLDKRLGKEAQRIKAVLPVHLYGQPCDMERILAVTRKHDLIVVEDAAQAHGSHCSFSGQGSASVGGQEGRAAEGPRVHRKRVGSMGDAGCFSFYPGKNLGAYGDAGAVVTKDSAFARKARMFANHGRMEKYEHEVVGVNSRLDTIQAAVLGVKLRYLEEWTELRRQHAVLYRHLLAEGVDSGKLACPVEAEYGEHVYHLFVVRVPDRDRLRIELKKHGIETGVHYPIPLHLSQAYRHLGYLEGEFPVAEKLSREILSLPMYPELNREQIAYICEHLLRELR